MRTRAVAPATVNAAIHRSLTNASIQASSNICLCPPFPSTSPHSFKLEVILCVSLFFLQCQGCVQRLLSPITVQKYLWGKLSQIYLLALKQVCRQYLKKLRLIYLLSLRNKLPKIENFLDLCKQKEGKIKHNFSLTAQKCVNNIRRRS